MAHVAFIGLGIMGRPMAVNLVKAGFDLRAFTRSEESRTRAGQSGVPVVSDLEGAVTGAEIVITMLPDTPDVIEIATRIAQVASPGTLLIDMSTIEPSGSLAVARILDEAGIASIDAPVSGGEAGAIEGSLSIMVGGAGENVARAMPVLEAVGSTIVHVGDAGSGQVVKAANQLIVAGNIQMLAEALVFLTAHDVEVDKALDVLGAGLAGSTVLMRKRAAMVTGNFAPGFRLTLHNKDLGIVQGAARKVGVALPLTSAVSQLVQSLVTIGDGDLDHSALYKLAAQMNAQPAGITATSL